MAGARASRPMPRAMAIAWPGNVRELRKTQEHGGAGPRRGISARPTSRSQRSLKGPGPPPGPGSARSNTREGGAGRGGHELEPFPEPARPLSSQAEELRRRFYQGPQRVQVIEGGRPRRPWREVADGRLRHNVQPARHLPSRPRWGSSRHRGTTNTAGARPQGSLGIGERHASPSLLYECFTQPPY